MVIAIIPFIIMIVGLLLWVLASNPKVSEAGRIMFFCGLLVTTFEFGRETVHFG